jgi:hypothetical protein
MVSPSLKLTWCKPSVEDRDTALAPCFPKTDFCACNAARGQFFAGEADRKAQEVVDRG